MFAKHAAHQAHLLEQGPETLSDFSHALNLKALATCLTRHIDPNVTQLPDDPRRPDDQVKLLWRLQYMEELNRHQAACIVQGIRRAWFDPTEDVGQLRLTTRRRRSALRLLDAPAQLSRLDAVTRGDLRGRPITDDEVLLALGGCREHLHYIEAADPDGWRIFSSGAGFTSGQLAMFSAFLVFLDWAAHVADHRLRYDDMRLAELFEIFKAGCTTVTDSVETLLSLVKTFSLTPPDSERYLLPVPFFMMDGYYIRAAGFQCILSPAMGLLTIAIRKNEDLWNRTLGSTLAKAADVVAQSLPARPQTYIATRRRLRPTGDIDLTIYDVERRRMLICEVKTVYDKHRTVTHLHRFEDAKVRLAHAVEQIRDAIRNVANGQTDLASIFGQKLPPPLIIDGALLTWIDPIDLTVGTENEDVPCLNFATFEYLYGLSEGNLDVMVRTIHELRNVWCVSKLQPIDLETDFPTRIEVQTGTMNSAAELSSLSLSGLTLAILSHLPHLPDDWASDDAFKDIVSYLGDSRRALLP